MVNKADRILSNFLLKRTLERRDPSLWKDLYVALIRPQLEYAVKTWNPYLFGEIEKHKKLVHRLALIIPEGFENLSHRDLLHIKCRFNQKVYKQIVHISMLNARNFV